MLHRNARLAFTVVLFLLCLFPVVASAQPRGCRPEEQDDRGRCPAVRRPNPLPAVGVRPVVRAAAGNRPGTCRRPIALRLGAGASVTGDTARARTVLTSSWEGDGWVIDSGLVAGERVVVDGTQRVTAGQPVRIVAAPDSAADATTGTAP